MEINKKRVFATFFGKPEIPRGSVVITPISKIYKRIKSKYPLTEETNGWWRRMKIKINSKRVLILKVPPGAQIKDCLKTFDSEKIKKVILLGFCGSLNEDLKIGDIIIPQKEKYKIANVSQMILKTSILQKMKKQGVDLLDMETYFLHRWRKYNHVPIITILIVTDLSESLPFFLCGKKEFRKINNSITKVVSQLNQYLQ